MVEAAPASAWALLITRNFPPLVGGMEKVNQHLLAALSSRFRVALSGPRGASAFAPPGARVRESRLRPLPWFLMAAAFRALALAAQIRPRIVVAGSGLTAPIAWAAARLTRGRAVVFLHGLDLVAPSRLYRALWLPFIRRCDVVLANSRHTAELARERGVPSDRIDVLNPGTTIPALEPAAGEAFRRRHEVAGRPLMLSVGRLTRRKGLAEFVERCLPGIVAARPDALLLIIGEEATDALHGGGRSERGRIDDAASRAGVSESVRFLGRCDEAALAAAYQAADCHVFAILEVAGDVEGFGMVALESAAHGLPTVAFSVGGVPDAIDVPGSGRLVRSGDYGNFGAAVLDVLAAGRGDGLASRAFADGKRWERFDASLLRLIGAD